MKFWDASAVVPLLVGERTTEIVRSILAADRQLHVWWGTEIECVSVIARLEREGVDSEIIEGAISRLATLKGDWSEVTPGTSVRELARRLLRVHPLRAADAQQLAAALVLADQSPPSVTLVCLDERLRLAAGREGLRLLPSRLSS